MSRDEYPEHRKLEAVVDQSQAIGAFLDWLVEQKDIALATRHTHTTGCLDDTLRARCGYDENELMLARTSIKDLLAEFFEIDQQALEREKREMLRKLRETQGG